MTNDNINPPEGIDPNKAKVNPAVSAANLLSVSIKDKNTLYATYMSFVKPEGGIFIPTKKEFKPGEKLTLLLSLLENPEKFEISTKVIWVTPKGVHDAKAPGIGLQFEGAEAKNLNNKIKQILVVDTNNELPTYTM